MDSPSMDGALGEPWAFKGRPAAPPSRSHHPCEIQRAADKDCHLHVSIDIEEMGHGGSMLAFSEDIKRRIVIQPMEEEGLKSRTLCGETMPVELDATDRMLLAPQ